MKEILLDLSQSNIEIDVSEDSNINGLFIGKNTDCVLSKLIIKFQKKDIKVRILIKSVLYDQANITLDCKIIVPKGIQNIDGYLDIKVLNLSENSHASITPSLEILEDNVKCGHALIIGKPDQDQIQYLKSRGLNETQALDLIVQGFIQK